MVVRETEEYSMHITECKLMITKLIGTNGPNTLTFFIILRHNYTPLQLFFARKGKLL